MQCENYNNDPLDTLSPAHKKARTIIARLNLFIILPFMRHCIHWSDCLALTTTCKSLMGFQPSITKHDAITHFSLFNNLERQKRILECIKGSLVHTSVQIFGPELNDDIYSLMIEVPLSTDERTTTVILRVRVEAWKIAVANNRLISIGMRAREILDTPTSSPSSLRDSILLPSLIPDNLHIEHIFCRKGNVALFSPFKHSENLRRMINALIVQVIVLLEKHDYTHMTYEPY